MIWSSSLSSRNHSAAMERRGPRRCRDDWLTSVRGSPEFRIPASLLPVLQLCSYRQQMPVGRAVTPPAPPL
jgi:hypothetical protein